MEVRVGVGIVWRVEANFYGRNDEILEEFATCFLPNILKSTQQSKRMSKRDLRCSSVLLTENIQKIFDYSLSP